MRIRATATTTMMNVPKGVARSMALSQILVAFVELVGGTGVADVEAVSEIEKKYTTVGIFLSCNAYCTLYLKDLFLKQKKWSGELGLRN